MEQEKYSWQYSKDDAIELFELYGKLLWHIEKDKAVPARKIKKFLSFFHKSPADDSLNWIQKLTDIRKQTLGYFKDNKTYYFNGEFEVVTGKTMVYRSLDSAIGFVTISLIDKQDIAGDETKLVKHIYRVLKKYTGIIDNKKQPISDYAIKVITGYTATLFSHFMTEETFNKSPQRGLYYAEYLFRETRKVLNRK